RHLLPASSASSLVNTTHCTFDNCPLELTGVADGHGEQVTVLRQLCGQIVVQDGHQSLTISYDELSAARTGVTQDRPRILIDVPLCYIGGPVIDTLDDDRLS